jgi:heptosyltransferase-3
VPGTGPLGLHRRSQRRMANDTKILVIRRRYLGDVVLLGSLLRNLKLHWPRARIEVLAEPSYAQVLAMNPDVDGTIAPPAGAFGWPAFAARLSRGGYSHVLDLDNTERTALSARLTGAARRVALHHGDHPVRLAALYTDVVYHPGAEHEASPITEYYLKALGPLGVPVATREVRLLARAADVADWRRFVGAAGRSVLVHPGSRSRWRLWPVENFARVCDRIQEETGAQAVLVGGPGDREEIAAIRRQARSHILAVDPPPSIARFAALAKACNLLLCLDSGPMHVAAAVGTRVVALYGSQNPVLFSPHGPGHTQVVPPMPCASCVSPGTCVPADSYRNHCVRLLGPDRVFEAVRDALGAWTRP